MALTDAPETMPAASTNEFELIALQLASPCTVRLAVATKAGAVTTPCAVMYEFELSELATTGPLTATLAAVNADRVDAPATDNVPSDVMFDVPRTAAPDTTPDALT